LANIFSVIYQKTIAVIVGFHFGPQVTGKIVAHISAVDAYSSFCSTFSQFIYKGKVLNVDPSSLEKAIRKFAIFTWLLVISTIITIIIFLPKEIMFGKIAINPFYISILVPSIIVLAFGSVFTHWMVVNNQQKKIPKYHFISLISLITFLILLKPLGPIAAILSRTLSALSGHAGMAILFKSERKQWWILCKCMIWPFSLEK
jgi:hypothetical protein